MKTDNIFYQLFQTLPSVLFEVLKKPVPKTQYTFKSLQLKELSRTIDGVFIPADKNHPIYFIEVQFQRDDTLYARLLVEVFMYLGQYKPEQKWQAVVFWAKRSLARPINTEYEALLESNLLQIIYLDEIKAPQPSTVGLGIIDLVVAQDETAVERVQGLTETTRRTISDLSLQRDIIELIEKVVIYKFPTKSNKELEAMFGLTEWKETQFYKDVKQEGLEEGEVKGEAKGILKAKLETIPELLKLGLTLEQIAEALKLDIAIIKQAIDNLPPE